MGWEEQSSEPAILARSRRSSMARRVSLGVPWPSPAASEITAARKRRLLLGKEEALKGLRARRLSIAGWPFRGARQRRRRSLGGEGGLEAHIMALLQSKIERAAMEDSLKAKGVGPRKPRSL